MPRGKTIPNLRAELAVEVNRYEELLKECWNLRNRLKSLEEERDFFKKITACLMEVIRAQHS